MAAGDEGGAVLGARQRGRERSEEKEKAPVLRGEEADVSEGEIEGERTFERQREAERQRRAPVRRSWNQGASRAREMKPLVGRADVNHRQVRAA